ncbi:putative autophagy protein Apg16 [Rhizodiscina lignyota]|uniref:Autophagy protein Apg16 n=1 Tax=Rhizodiscina lignyota TaxID=1504668 RepID=A0A9P4IQE6_9PEZI|nr:putative autophagy protein Apg16 [Rhizodiscina lignyota]
MKSWISEYSSALDARDVREKAQLRFVNAYTKLADRTATLESANSSSPPVAEAPSVPSPSQRTTSPGLSIPFRGKSPQANVPDDTSNLSPSDALNRLRSDLATTQRSRAALQSQLAPVTSELATLKSQSARDTKRISELERDRSILERRVKDRDEEIKGKARLVEEVQDEMLSLNLQLNMAEQRSEKLETENKQLVDRWMERMGREAEEMNERSKWT